ncbi:oligoendopeptidase F [Roseiconus lacunae]|uniref:oligoendopeptidase F n=1 Tax=Roseiconus lacunae TaxID=2605694 RepID=UPI0011F14A96|nr:oligoendopeptidase F [Roseiconus lacunae]MCD0463519.1 oligoendopeptidase F [Roseiconus lacunae]WRQ53325.1 oligoendopeptidase F [Stieleria sp. HD01]
MSTASPSANKLPSRSDVSPEDCWDLSTLFENDEQWEAAFKALDEKIATYETYKGRLGESPETLREAMDFDSQFSRDSERVAIYAFLKTTEDQGNSDYQAMKSRFQNLAVRASQVASYWSPELLGIDPKKMDELVADPALQPYRLDLERLLRRRPHTLTDREERLLAMQGEMASAAGNAFRQLNDVDLRFGTVEDEDGNEHELSHATFIQLLHKPTRKVRRAAFQQYYQEISEHENTLAATLAGSIHSDVYYARARNHDSALHAALFPDNVPVSVYDNLISAVRESLPSVHEYFDVRRRKMDLPDIHHFDTYVPILSDMKKEHTWDQAVDVVIESLSPLGSDYTNALEKGLRGRWADRYPNRGKQSGAFSCGSFDGAPYILMNFKTDVLNDVYTLTHEAGHSMHSYYSASNQPFQYYNYTIFVAEVASTFNEQLLTEHLLKNADSDAERAFLINNELDGIRATVVRQTMFAEFEKRTHEMAENGDPLTVASMRAVYRELLDAYFGPEFVVDKELELECFRIPHFYRAFYVYKYATGLSAAVALSRRVLEGGQGELDDYLKFLSGGCSKDPLDLLRDAGVDMEKPEPVKTTLDRFKQLTKELDSLL